MDSHLWAVLKKEIHDKCVYYEYVGQADTSLSDFIVDIIQIGKSPDEVSSELRAYQYLTQWMFARIDELKNQGTVPSTTNIPPTSSATPVSSTNEIMMTDGDNATASMERRTTRKNRMFTQALSGLGQPSHQQPRLQSRGFDSTMEQQSRTEDHDRREGHQRTDYSSDRRHQQKSQPDRRQHHRVDLRHRSRSRSRSRSPIRHKERTTQREYKGDTIFARLGKPSGGSSSSTSNSASPSVFDRLGIRKPEPDRSQPYKQQRCKYWPTCDQGDDCTYFHPDTLCPDFPNCPNKPSECMFIHPYTPKKPSHQPVTDNTLTERAIPCRYFPHCNNDQCPYFHPPAIPSFFESQQQGPPYSTYQPYQPPMPTPKRIPVPCKNGENCTRPDCYFMHPKDGNPSEIICKFDGACTRPGCFYKHTTQTKPMPYGKTLNKSLVVNPSSFAGRTNKSERSFVIADDSQVEKMQLGESADLIKPAQQNQGQELDTEMDL
ncbi:hypothetical protein BC941DRAFT_461559 [Chlamydoabsidia padenii]|nr:hypothetical protein BC941DRAFT_461559 [Chlamydoabsidia padenii]